MKNQPVKTDYDAIPIGYYHNAMLNGPTMQRFWHRKKFETVAGHITAGSSILDIGCGPGSFSYIVSEIQPSASICGIDIAQGQIDFAKNYILPNVKNGKFQRFDGNSIQDIENSYDFVTLIEVIEHLSLKTAGRLLEEAFRVLKPGGKLLITTPNYASQWPLLEKLLEILSPIKYGEQHISRFTKSSLLRVVEAEGFNTINIGSLFVIAPYIAMLNYSLGSATLNVERSCDLGIGSLLVGIFEKSSSSLFVHQSTV